MCNKTFASMLIALTLLTAAPALSRSQSPSRKPVYIAYADAKPILEILREALPVDLQSVSAADMPAAWPRWTARRDADIRARLVQGDEDSVINFMLFGTTFTRRPRITLGDLAQARQNAGAEAATFLEAIKSRASDLVQGMLAPG